MTAIKYTVPRGARDPWAVRVEIDATAIPLAKRVIADLTDVTAVELHVTDKNSGAVEVWAMTLVSETADLIVYDHLLSEDDTATLRLLHLVPWQTAAGAANPIPATGFDLQVVEP